MQRAKAREFDHVVVITDPRAHRKEAPLSELRRLQYVACTTARQSLFVPWNSSQIGDVLGRCCIRTKSAAASVIIAEQIGYASLRERRRIGRIQKSRRDAAMPQFFLRRLGRSFNAGGSAAVMPER